MSNSQAHESLIPKLEGALQGSPPKIRAVVGLIVDHDFGGSAWLGEPLTRVRITSDEKVVAETSNKPNVLVDMYEPVVQSIAAVLDAAGFDKSEWREFTRLYFDRVIDQRKLEPDQPEPATPMAESQQMKPESKSSPSTESQRSPTGRPPRKDAVVWMLERLHKPVTRENYLQLAYFGRPPETLSGEQEAELPEELQQWD